MGCDALLIGDGNHVDTHQLIGQGAGERGLAPAGEHGVEVLVDVLAAQTGRLHDHVKHEAALDLNDGDVVLEALELELGMQEDLADLVAGSLAQRHGSGDGDNVSRLTSVDTVSRGEDPVLGQDGTTAKVLVHLGAQGHLVGSLSTGDGGSSHNACIVLGQSRGHGQEAGQNSDS